MVQTHRVTAVMLIHGSAQVCTCHKFTLMFPTTSRFITHTSVQSTKQSERVSRANGHCVASHASIYKHRLARPPAPEGLGDWDGRYLRSRSADMRLSSCSWIATMLLPTSLPLSLFFISLAVPGLGSLTKRSPAPTFNHTSRLFHTERDDTFANELHYTFTGSSLPSGLAASNWGISDPGAPFNHVFTPANAYVSGGYLNLKVPGGQTNSPLSAGEVSTTVSNIFHASVRTVAVLTDVPGVCNGFFFYKNDQQEIDIEWLSDSTSLSNPRDGSRPLHLTNQDANGDGQKTFTTVPVGTDVVNTEHEYRMDWTEGRVGFYFDGELKWETGSDVPTVPGSWIWNNWANGDPGWTGNPPAQDAIVKIKEIDIFYNTA